MTPPEFPESLIFEPSTIHDITVVLLHGRGSTGKEFSKEFFDTSSSSGESLQDRFPSVRWVFPSAKCRTSTVFQEEVSEWYDVYSLSDPEARLDLQKPGLVESICYVTEILDFERQRFEKQQVRSSQRPGLILGGISMGCAVGIHVLLSVVASGNGQHIAGFFGWCGWLPFGHMFRERIESARRDGTVVTEYVATFYRKDIGIIQREMVDEYRDDETDVALPEAFSSVPVFLSHCNDDNVIEPQLGRELKEALKSLEIGVEWHEYPHGGHWIKEPEAMNDFATFLERLRKL